MANETIDSNNNKAGDKKSRKTDGAKWEKKT